MAVLREIDITYAGKTEHAYVRRLRYSTSARLYGMIRAGFSEGGKVSIKDIPAENLANYRLNLIAESVVDAEGKKLYTPEEVDAWSDEEFGVERINAYAEAIDVKVDKETVAGN